MFSNIFLMAQQIINNGSFDNDPSAEKIRTAFDKVNENFDELYTMGGGTSDLALTPNPTNNLVSNTNGTGFTIAAADGTNAGLFLPSEKVKVTAIDQAVSSTEKATWNSKQDALVSGTNIKTINGSSILGSGDLAVTGKRTHTVIFSHFTSAADFTNWYSKNRNPQTFGGITFVAYAGLTPTNDFANDTYQGHNHVLPFQCKVKSVFVKMRSNTAGSIPIDVAIQTVEFPNGSNDSLSTSGINPKIIARETVTQLSSSQQPNVKFASGSLVTTHIIAEKSLCKLFWKNNFGASAGALEMSVIVEFEEI